jgi:hypothetical protein
VQGFRFIDSGTPQSQLDSVKLREHEKRKTRRRRRRRRRRKRKRRMKLTTFDAASVNSLVWQHDSLVDWKAGGTTYELDGTQVSSRIYYGGTFDETVASRSGEYVALVTRRGTKALLLREGKPIRELDRSYYCADSYDYPIAFVTLSDGREAIIHCPKDYNRLEVEVAETGEILASASPREPSDFFHSRLKVSPSQRYLASCGWIWHPVDHPMIFDIRFAEKDSAHFDGTGIELPVYADNSSLAFLSDEEIVVALSGEMIDNKLPIDGTELSVFTNLNGLVERKSVATYAGQISLVCGVLGGGVLALGDSPVIIDPRTGDTLMSWPELCTKTVAIGALGESTKQDFIFAARDDGRGFALWRDGKLHIAV